MLDLSRLQEEVAEAKTVGESARALIAGLAQKVRDTAGDPAAVEALATELDQANASLAAAVSENTPSEEPPVEPPVEPIPSE